MSFKGDAAEQAACLTSKVLKFGQLGPRNELPEGFAKRVGQPTDLPQREAMSLLVDPGALLGGGLIPNAPGSPTAPGAPAAGTPQAAPTPGSDVPTPGGTIHVPNVPVPEQNPGGTYNPDTSTTSKG